MKPVQLLLALLVVPAITLAQPPEQPRVITTTGEAEVRVAPDRVILSLGVESSNKELAIPKSDNDTSVQRVLKALADSGVEPAHMQTEHISIEPRYRDTYDQHQFLGYWVRRSITATVTDVSKFEATLSAALEAGTNYVHGVQFITSESRKHRDSAREMAIKAAAEKATALASSLNARVGAPRTIGESSGGMWSSYGGHWGGGMYANTTQNVVQTSGGGGDMTGEQPLAPGQIKVSASVTVTFDLIPDNPTQGPARIAR